MLTTMFDAPMRMTITLTDGTTKVLDVSAYSIVGAVRVAAAKTKIEAETKPEKAPDSAKTYAVPDFTDEELRALTAGDWDDPALMITKAHQKRVTEALCAMRRKFFKLPQITYTVRDAILFTTMFTAGVRPSTLSQAVLMASKDPFWMKHGDIGIKSLHEHHSKLAGAYVNQRNSPAAYITRSLDKLDEIDPAFATAIREHVAKAKEVELAEIVNKVKARLDAHRAMAT